MSILFVIQYTPVLLHLSSCHNHFPNLKEMMTDDAGALFPDVMNLLDLLKTLFQLGSGFRFERGLNGFNRIVKMSERPKSSPFANVENGGDECSAREVPIT